MKRFILALAALLACAGPVAAQRTPTYQGGAITPGDVAKFQANGPVTSAGNLLGDGTGRGVNPFAILDRNDLGVCANNAVTGGQYNALCFGHDSSGNGLITLDSYGGLSGKAVNCRVNGILIENCLSGGTVTGLSIRPGTGLASSPDPITSAGEIWLEDTAVTPGTYAYPTALAVDQQGRLTSITAGSSPALPCTSPSGSLQYDASGNFGCATVGAGLLMSGGALTQTQTINNQSGSDYTVLTGDAAKTVLTGNHAYTLPQAGTAGFEAGAGFCFLAAGASGGTLTTTGSIFSGAGDGSSITFRSGDWACPSSDGSNWQTLVSYNYLGVTSGLPMVGGGTGQPLTSGTRSGNTTQFATVTGSKTSGNLLSWDASGNAVDSGISSVTASGGGDVTGPGSAVSGNIATFNGTTGKIIQDSGIAASGVLVSGGALGTPSSGTLTNATGLPIGGISGLGTGVATFLGSPVGNVLSTWLASGAAVANLGFTPPPNTRTITAGTGLSGGGDLSADRTLSVNTTQNITKLSNLTSNGLVKTSGGDGTLGTATAGTDYAAAPSGSANTPLFNNGSGGFTNGTRSGNTTSVATTSGTLTSGNCAKFDASGNVVDNGSTCAAAAAAPTINTQTASYQLVLADANNVVEMNVGSANNLTVPTNATVAFPTGTTVYVRQLGAGQTTLVAAGGVTLRTPETLKIQEQYGGVWLQKRATDEWTVEGRLEPTP